jgi:hypothetical protein
MKKLLLGRKYNPAQFLSLCMVLLCVQMGRAQGPWNFPTDVQSWVVQGSSTVGYDSGVYNTASGSLKCTTTAISAGAKSPTFYPATAGQYTFSAYIKGTAGDKVRLDIFQGTSSVGAEYTLLTSNFELVTRTVTVTTAAMTLRIIDRTGSKTFYIDDVTFTYIPPAGSVLTSTVAGSGTVTKSPDQPSYPTATSVTLTATPTTHWLFNNWAGDLTGSTNPGTVNLDGTNNKSVTANFVIDPAFNYDFKFNTDGNLEGWTLDPLLVLTSHTGGLVTLTPSADQFARFNLLNFPISSSAYNKLTIKLQNNSATTDQLAIVAGVTTANITTLSTSDAGIMTYVIDLTQNLGWTGDVTSLKLRFADADNPNAGKPSDTGSIIIDDITFSFDASLGLDSKIAETNEISVYPIPAREVINVSSAVKISSAEVYDVTGKMVLRDNQLLNNQINVSNLKSGIYILRLKNVDNKFEDKKVVISN